MKTYLPSLVCLATACTLLLNVPGVYAQSQNGVDYLEKNFESSSPTQESLQGVSGGLPVHLHTGAVAVDVPLLSLSSRQLSLPISLRYVSNGVHVQEASGWVGHTWQLDAGGAIHRELRGLPDELPNRGYFTTGAQVQDFENLPESEQAILMDASAERTKDTEPDIFHYNFGGRSGKFVIDDEGEVRLMPHQNYLIERFLTDDRLTRFVITTKNGTIYEFGSDDLSSVEETKLTVLNYSIKFNYMYGTADGPTISSLSGINYNYAPWIGGSEKKDIAEGYYTSKWHLISIETPDRQDEIKLTHTEDGESVQIGIPQITESFAENTFPNPYYPGLEYPTPTTDVSGGLLMQREPGPGPEAFDSPFLVSRGEGTPLEAHQASYGSFISVSRSKTQTRVKRLATITNAGGDKVRFVKSASTTRSDLSGELSSLAAIEVVNSQDKLVKKFTLHYQAVRSSEAYTDPLSIDEAVFLDQYGVSLTAGPGKSLIEARRAINSSSAIGDGDLKDFIFEGLRSYNYNRLFLDKVIEEGESGVFLSYRFDYYLPEKLPRKTSLKVNQNGLMRESYARRAPDKGFIRDQNGGYVERNFTYSSERMFDQNYDVINALTTTASGNTVVGMLKSVRYPTAGRKEFIYNGGSRATVHKIIDYHPDNEVAMVKRIGYGSYVDTNPPLFKSFREYYYDDNQVTTNYTVTSYNQRGVGVGGSGFTRSIVYQQSDPNNNESWVGREAFDFTVPHKAPRTRGFFDPVEEVTNHISKVYSYPKEAGYDDPYFRDAYPFPRDHDFSYRVGLVTRHVVYGRDDKKRRETIYSYKAGHEEFPGKVVNGLTGGKFIYKTKKKYSFLQGQKLEPKFRYRGGLYQIVSRRVYLDKKTERVYEQDEADVITTATNFDYDPKYLHVKKETTTDSEGTEWVTEYGYPTDFAQVMIAGYEPDGSIRWNGIAGGRHVGCIQRMLTTHRHNQRIQTTRRRKRVGENQYKTISGDLTLFSFPDGASSLVIYPEQYFELYPNIYNLSPVFTITEEEGILRISIDADYYPTQTFEAYDKVGNLLQSTGRDNVPTSQLYSYKNSLPIAQAVGAAHNQIAYTGFEAPEKDRIVLASYYLEGNFRWLYNQNAFSSQAYTGKQSYAGRLVREDLPAGQYNVSCWAKRKPGSQATTVYVAEEATAQPVTDDWTYLEWTIDHHNESNLVVASNGNLIDEVRIHPVGSQMTTSTYNPLVGVTSETDANGQTTYYEYDALNRLRLVKDQHRDIRQRYQYVYKSSE